MFTCCRLPNILGPRNCMFTVHFKRQHFKNTGLPEDASRKSSNVMLRRVAGTSCDRLFVAVAWNSGATSSLCLVEMFSWRCFMLNVQCPKFVPIPTIQYHWPHGKSCASHDLPRSTVPSVHVWHERGYVTYVKSLFNCNPLWTLHAIDPWWQIVNPSHFWSVPRETLKRTQRTLEAYPAYPSNAPNVPLSVPPTCT